MKKQTLFFLIAGFFILTQGVFSRADDKVGTLTAVEGHVEILSNPHTNYKEGKFIVIHEGAYWHYKQGKPGDRVADGSVIRTSPESRARVVYDNGDQISIGPSTYYQIKWSGSQAEANLKFGKIRSVISSKGPRKHFKVKTAGATMGVRGTDFFVESKGDPGTAKVTVLRGNVEYTEVAQATQMVQADKTGVSGKVRDTSKKELSKIRELSALDAASPGGEAEQRIMALEKKALDNSIDEIKAQHPMLHQDLLKSKPTSLEELDERMLGLSILKAPDTDYDLDASQQKKAQEKYKKYFKSE